MNIDETCILVLDEELCKMEVLKWNKWLIIIIVVIIMIVIIIIIIVIIISPRPGNTALMANAG